MVAAKANGMSSKARKGIFSVNNVYTMRNVN